VNGVGSAAGGLVAAFWLVGSLGNQGAFVLLALLCAMAGSAVLYPMRRRLAGAPLLAACACALLVPAHLPRRMLLEVLGSRHVELVHYEEARTGTISVTRNTINGERQLVINSVNEVTTRLVHDQSFKLLGHLGPLLHPSPRRAVMVCLGAGLSAGAALTHPLERLDVVDLSSAVARGARFFERENRGALDDPRLSLTIDDGRQFLLDSHGGYDVAIVDSTHPKSVDSWILYTKEFYELVRDRLADGGIAVQWLPLHGLSEREFQIIVRTFLSVFPDMTLWANAGFETYGHVAYAKLVGRRGGRIVIDRASLSAKLADRGVRDDLEPFGIGSADEILGLLVAHGPAIANWTAGLPVQTDDRPIVPFCTRFSRGRRMTPPLLLAVREIAPGGEAQGLVLAGNLDRAALLHPESRGIALYVEQTKTTRAYYTELAGRYPDRADRLFESASQLASLGDPEDARAVSRQALALAPRDIRLLLGAALLDSDVRKLGDLRVRAPASAVIAYDLGAALLDAGEPGAAALHLRAAIEHDPDLVGARLALARAYFQDGKTERAELETDELLRRTPWVAEAHDLLGLVEARRGRASAAAARHRDALRIEPYSPDLYYHLGLALMSAGDLDGAEAALGAALRYGPAHAASADALGLVHAASGRWDKAVESHLRALEIDPRRATAAENLGVALRRLGRLEEAKGAFCLALRLSPGLAVSKAALAGSPCGG
jgi:spermidine synthase/tetratricopeptide (TPR) repeat protein